MFKVLGGNKADVKDKMVSLSENSLPIRLSLYVVTVKAPLSLLRKNKEAQQAERDNSKPEFAAVVCCQEN